MTATDPLLVGLVEQMAPRQAHSPLSDAGWERWLLTLFPSYCSAPFADHHRAFWEWLWAIEPLRRPEAFVGVWPRGGAKSTSAELGVVALAARRVRRYGLYVCDTQDRADDHVGNVGALLESERLGELYPKLAARAVGKYGSSKGWRRNRLRTAAGFTLDAIGLDTASRGVKLEDQRPDLIVVDDIDGEHDGPTVTKRKIDSLTKSLLPAGSEDVAVVAIQNLVQPNGVFARLVDGRADFLRRRTVSGPIPALRDFTVDDTGRLHGTASWAGQNLERCRAQAEDWGLRAFRTEAQHDVADTEGALWTRATLDTTRLAEHPDLVRVAVAVDPPGGRTEAGIVAVGAGRDRHGYVIGDASGRMPPEEWGRAAIDMWRQLDADEIVAEVNYGGDMVASNIAAVARGMHADGDLDSEYVPVRIVRATRGKVVRAEPAASMFQQQRAHMVGAFPDLEGELTGWTPDDPESPNRLDAMVWGFHAVVLGHGGRGRVHGSQVARTQLPSITGGSR